MPASAFQLFTQILRSFIQRLIFIRLRDNVDIVRSRFGRLIDIDKRNKTADHGLSSIDLDDRHMRDDAGLAGINNLGCKLQNLSRMCRAREMHAVNFEADNVFRFNQRCRRNETRLDKPFRRAAGKQCPVVVQIFAFHEACREYRFWLNQSLAHDVNCIEQKYINAGAEISEFCGERLAVFRNSQRCVRHYP